MKRFLLVTILILCYRVTAQTVSRDSYGQQCGQGAEGLSCPIVNGRIEWPTTRAQPGVLRLWDTNVAWHNLQRDYGWDWKMLDLWLDQIQAHQPLTVIYTLGRTPCYLVPDAPCYTFGASAPPPDLTRNGSVMFNDFVTKLVTHCTSSGVCVKDVIKWYELWNEANKEHFWEGTIQQCYDMMKPAVKIIRANVPNAIIYTPPPTSDGVDWSRQWVDIERHQGKISDVFAFHTYMSADKPPEKRIDVVKNFLAVKNSVLPSAPWSMTETNYDSETFECTATHDECVGQVVRWQVLNMALGGSVIWFRFNFSIGHEEHRTDVYNNMMTMLDGAKFGECTVTVNGFNSCPLTEGNGASAVIVWNVGDFIPYNPAREYNQYRDFVTGVGKPSSGIAVLVGRIPLLFEHVDK